MKKIMFMLGVAACAVGVQAATVSWSLTGVNNGGSGVNGYAYVFSNKGTYATPDALKTALAAITTAAGMQEFMTANSLSALNSAVSGGGAGKSGIDLATSGIPQNTSGTRIFAVVFDTATITDDSNYYVTTTSGGVKTPSATTSNNAQYSIASQAAATAAADAWTKTVPSGGGTSGGDAPEPTSGLLLLVGGAMLALRRKQK